MTAYVDSSVVLRLALGEPGSLAEWPSIRSAVASTLLEVECLRTLDRLRVRAALSDRDLAVRREAVYRLLELVDVVELTRPVLARAAQPMSTELGTLDAIHLATALLWREGRETELVMATHDWALALAARARSVCASSGSETESLAQDARLSRRSIRSKSMRAPSPGPLGACTRLLSAPTAWAGARSGLLCDLRAPSDHDARPLRGSPGRKEGVKEPTTAEGHHVAYLPL